MNKYELMFIIDPVLDDEKKDAVVETVKGIIAASGEVAETDIWGLKKLAYPIQKKTEGYYVVMQFTATPDLPKELPDCSCQILHRSRPPARQGRRADCRFHQHRMLRQDCRAC